MKAHDELWACLSLSVVYINTSTSVYLDNESVPFRYLIHAMAYGSWVHVGACDGSQIAAYATANARSIYLLGGNNIMPIRDLSAVRSNQTRP